MDENGEILLLHANKNNACPLVLPWFDDFEISTKMLHRGYDTSRFLRLVSPRRLKLATNIFSPLFMSLLWEAAATRLWFQ